MEELKPCPFCGGEAELWASEDGIYGVWCSNPDCYMDVDTRDRTSKEAAIEAWNTRYERTCRIVQHGHLFTMSDGTELYESACSECGAYLGDEDNYCSISGAKVVE